MNIRRGLISEPGSGSADGAKRGPFALRDWNIKERKKVERRRGVKKIRVVEKFRAAKSCGQEVQVGCANKCDRLWLPLPKVRFAHVGTFAEGKEFRFRTEFDSPKTPQLFVVESGSIQLVVLRNIRKKQIKEKCRRNRRQQSSKSNSSGGAIGKSSVTHSSSSYPSYEPASSIHR